MGVATISAMRDAAVADLVVADLYREHGLDPGAPPGPAIVAGRLGIRLVELPLRLMGGADSAYSNGSRGPTAYLAAGLALPRALYAVAYRSARRWLTAVGYAYDDMDRLSETVAAAIVVPREAFVSGRRAFSVAEMACQYRASHSLIHLREAECLDVETALVTRDRVRLRGPALVIPRDEQHVRGIARADILPAHVARSRVLDDPSRVLLRAA